MSTGLIQYRGYRYTLRLSRDYDPRSPSWKADEQHKAIDDGRKMFDAAYLDVWERNAELWLCAWFRCGSMHPVA